MRANRRLLLLLALLGGVIVLIILDDTKKSITPTLVDAVSPRDGSVRPPSPPHVSPRQDEPAPTILPLRPRTAQEALPADAFVSRDWTPPPPPPPPAPPPPPPQAPPLPFTFVGKQFEAGEWVVFLARQDRTYVVRSGDTIETNYQVSQVAPPLLTLTYLPLKQTQTLAIGTAE